MTRCPLAVLGTALALSGCGEAGELIAFGDLPPGAQSAVVALEQGTNRALHAHGVTSEALRFSVPAEFDAGSPIALTRVSFREPLLDLGLAQAGPLPGSSEPRRPLSTLAALAIENTSLSSDSGPSSFLAGVASDWILQHPIPRPAGCIERVSEGFAADTRPPRDLLPVGSDLAVGLSLREVVVFRSDESVQSFSLPLGEFGRVLGLGINDRVWVATSSRAGVLDLASGNLAEVVLLEPSLGLAIGIAEHPITGELYLLSDQAELWVRRSGMTTFERLYSVPRELVRIDSLHKQAARFSFDPSGRFIVAVDDISALLEVTGEEVELLSTEPVGAGFPVLATKPDGVVLLVESAFGTIYEYRPGQIDRVGQTATQVEGLAPLDAEGRRWIYAGHSPVIGTFDLRHPGQCDEVPLGTWVNVSQLIGFGPRFLAGGHVDPDTYGWRWLRLEF